MKFINNIVALAFFSVLITSGASGAVLSNYESVAPLTGSSTGNTVIGTTVPTNVAGLTITHSVVGPDIAFFETTGRTDTDSGLTDMRPFVLGALTQGSNNPNFIRTGEFHFDFSSPVNNLEHTMYDLDGEGAPSTPPFFEQYKVKAYLAGTAVLPCTVTMGANVTASGTGANTIYEGTDTNALRPWTEPANSLASLFCAPVDKIVIEARGNWGIGQFSYFSGGSLPPIVPPPATAVPTLGTWALLFLIMGLIIFSRNSKLLMKTG